MNIQQYQTHNMNSPEHMSQSLFFLLLMFLFYQYMSLSMIKLNLYSITLYSITKYKNKIVNRRVKTKSNNTIVNFVLLLYTCHHFAVHFSKDLSIARPTYYPYKDTNLIPLSLLMCRACEIPEVMLQRY